MLDVSLAIVRRLRNGMPIFAPDKKHLHHVLLDARHSHRSASALLSAWALVISVGGAWIVVFPSWRGLTAVVVCAGVLLLLDEVGIRRRWLAKATATR